MTKILQTLTDVLNHLRTAPVTNAFAIAQIEKVRASLALSSQTRGTGA